MSNEFMQDGISATEQRVHSVDATTWIGRYGPMGINGVVINGVVDQVEQALLG